MDSPCRKPVICCCLCAKPMDDCTKTIITWGKQDAYQQWWAHQDCLREALHPDYRDALIDPDDYPEW